MFFFFNDTATTEIYTLSLHDALPICRLRLHADEGGDHPGGAARRLHGGARLGLLLGLRLPGLQAAEDRKSTRLNSSHANISYAVFCLKKKNLRTFLLSYFTFPFVLAL